MIEWLVLLGSLALLMACVIRSGLAGSTRDAITFIAIGLVSSGLRGVLTLSISSTAGAALTVIELAALIYAGYLLWRGATS